MDNYDVEEIILTMADMVRENRMLRVENKRLREFEEKYYQSINDRFVASEEASRNMLNAAIIGITMGKNDKELMSDLVGYL